MNFCSREALAAHGALPGTGVYARAYVFLPVPKRFWRSNELNEGWAGAEEVLAVREARRAGIVTRLYDPAGAEPQVMVRTAPDQDRQAALAMVAATFDRRWPVEPVPTPLMAVCTHGTRDRCCAKWGYAAYRSALALHRGGASPFRPVQCSHLGGDRFAATGIFFPSGSMYAYLDQADLPRLIDAEASGALVREGYRGRVFEAERVQVVRAGLAAEHGLTAASDPIAVETLETAGETLRLLARAGGRAFEVSLQRRELRFFGDCDQLAAGRRARARSWTYAGAHIVTGADPPAQASPRPSA